MKIKYKGQVIDERLNRAQRLIRLGKATLYIEPVKVEPVKVKRTRKKKEVDIAESDYQEDSALREGDPVSEYDKDYS